MILLLWWFACCELVWCGIWWFGWFDCRLGGLAFAFRLRGGFGLPEVFAGLLGCVGVAIFAIAGWGFGGVGWVCSLVSGLSGAL